MVPMLLRLRERGPRGACVGVARDVAALEKQGQPLRQIASGPAPGLWGLTPHREGRLASLGR